MKNKVETPIYLVTADIYLRFPEIMEEEYRDLLEYLDDEHILYERCTGEVNELQQKVNYLELDVDSYKSKYKGANRLYLDICKEVRQLETNIAEAINKLNSFVDCCKAEKLESNNDRLHYQYWDMFEGFNKQVKEILERGKENE